MSSTEAVCTLCNRQVAKYVCPTCNVPYCSILCFRSPAHGECSEGFYRKEISQEGGANAKTEERLRMMEMLKRLEETDGLSDEDEEDELADVAARFDGIDLDDTAAIWERLSPEQRARFMATPFAALVIKPWWEDPDAPMPRLPEIPAGLSPQPTLGIALNLVAVVLAYAYTCRHLAAQQLEGEKDAPQIIARLVPFLIEPHSTFVFTTLDDVVTSLASRDVPVKSLLPDAVSILRMAVVSTLDTHPHDRSLRAMGDIYQAFTKRPRVQRKIVWYAACISACVGRGSILGRVVQQIEELAHTEKIKETELSNLDAGVTLKAT
ncbi:hypothetical protein CYLTODRAFT_485162 [Cylindrobasidium torrendii FP15055 ss-10]|uniref:HIT-type domain-containing protein n=1 Tax=Cylindrobasidium torrendii FP15055 ss-10 TaxID=1314674 RepID=A0A0D7BTS1_9AGAR|nr:hypothetical protein CYLTODRAFT_485162 [Cylindrobasidium torrendii FP15055 ss-10]